MGFRILDALFSLRVNLYDGSRLNVTAFDMAQYDEETGRPIYTSGHHAITWRATHKRADGSSEVVWEPGQSWLGIPGHQTIDGEDAREGVLHSLSMKPGDTDADFFEGWTDAQRAFGEAYGETIAMISEERYGIR